MILEICLVIIGFILLIKGADWFVSGATGIAKRLGIPELVVGLTIVAMGTSAPETAVSITSALEHNAQIAIGNVIGSNILNILIILGITALITKVPIKESTFKIEIPFMILITIILIVVGSTDSIITRTEGMLLILFFVGYLVYLYVLACKGKSEKDTGLAYSTVKLIVLVLVGIAVVVAGSRITVESATALAKTIGISDSFIGLTIVALGTSLPELVTSVVAAKNGNADIAIGNIVGSNIFNILFIMGTTSIITPVPYADNFIIDGIIATLAGIVLWFLVLKKRALGKLAGIIMLALYGAYFIYLLV